MQVGVMVTSYNHRDWDRLLAGDYSRGPSTADVDIHRQTIALGDMVEPLGFDSIWTVEHHFTPYTMVPNPLQFLTYMAGRTERVDFGTMVVVLPWHDPIRVAEEIAMLDLLAQGRRVTLGFGRGAGKVEFEGFRTPMGESRERFLESLEIVRRALELGASAVILVHNHPSGDPTPSRTDIAMTQEIKRAAEALGVTVHDHLIIGRGRHASFKALGLL